MSRLVLAAIIALGSAPTAWAGHVMTPGDAHEAALADEVTVVDVRLPFEWAETGMPAGSTGVPLQDPGSLAVRPGFVDDLLAAVGGDKDLPIALICARGNRSAYALRLLEDAGFTAVHDIGEGMLGNERGPGWLARDLPVEPCESC